MPLSPTLARMSAYAFPPPPHPSLAIAGSDARLAVHRIYCIGRNYAEHAREMGAPVERGQPLFFMKPADALVADEGHGIEVPYPPATQELHHEVEMIVALARGGRDIAREHALDCVHGYGVGLDLTRRDLQAIAKTKGQPWDAAKGFDASAPASVLVPVARCGHPQAAALTLAINGEQRQHGDIADMLFDVAAIIHELSLLWTLAPGDLIYTGTPAGVGPLVRGDRLEASLTGIASLHTHIT